MRMQLQTILGIGIFLSALTSSCKKNDKDSEIASVEVQAVKSECRNMSDSNSAKAGSPEKDTELKKAVETLRKTWGQPASEERKAAIKLFKAYIPGNRKFDPHVAKSNGDNFVTCAEELAASAIVANLHTGIPATALLAQALLVTEGCSSTPEKVALWEKAHNFHRQTSVPHMGELAFGLGDSWKEERVCLLTSTTQPAETLDQSYYLVFEHPDLSFIAAGRRFHFFAQDFNAAMLNRYDPKAFLQGLSAGGSQGEEWKKYAQVIEKYGLEKLTITRDELIQNL
jgi:hypothetical protein